MLCNVLPCYGSCTSVFSFKIYPGIRLSPTVTPLKVVHEIRQKNIRSFSVIVIEVSNASVLVLNSRLDMV